MLSQLGNCEDVKPTSIAASCTQLTYTKKNRRHICALSKRPCQSFPKSWAETANKNENILLRTSNIKVSPRVTAIRNKYIFCTSGDVL